MSTVKSTQKESNSLRIIKTSRFGDLEINQDKIITMTSPFLGFPDENNFVLVPHGEKSPFWWLQSVHNTDLAFVVIQPTIINPEYKPAVSKQNLKELQANKAKELELLLILTIPEGKPEDMTANLLGPIALNADRKLAKQLLLDPNQYSPCWPIPLVAK